MNEQIKPTNKPNRPNFSSGPCAKIPGWTSDVLKDALVGRSHRSKEGKAKIAYMHNLIREVLEVPDDYKIAMVPASDTGAFELAMWNLLGPKDITAIGFDSFGKGWINDIENELKLPVTKRLADYGELPDLSNIPADNDIVFAANGTTAGVRVPNFDFIANDREGLVFCDATSYLFAYDMDWNKVDATTFSWQKVMGGEGSHGVLILSPKAIERLESYNPEWPLPKIFRIKKKDTLNHAMFIDSPINTPSMIAIEDFVKALEWSKDLGGIKGLVNKVDENYQVIKKLVDSSDNFDFLCEEEENRSKTSVCLKITADWFLKLSEEEQKVKHLELLQELDNEKIAFDIKNYKVAPMGLRIWCGATIEKTDLTILCEWLDYEIQEK